MVEFQTKQTVFVKSAISLHTFAYHFSPLDPTLRATSDSLQKSGLASRHNALFTLTND